MGLLEATTGILGGGKSRFDSFTGEFNAPLTVNVTGGSDFGFNFQAALSQHIDHIVAEVERVLELRNERKATL